MRCLLFAILLYGAGQALLVVVPPHGDGGMAWIYIVSYPTMAGAAGLTVLAGARGRLRDKWLGALGWIAGFILSFRLADPLISENSHFLSFGEERFLHAWFIILFPSAFATVVYKLIRLASRKEERDKLSALRNILAGLVVLLPLALVGYKETLMIYREKQVEAGAAAGDEAAKCNLAEWQWGEAAGLAIRHDLPQALELYRRAGDAGLADAQWHVGRMYIDGEGTAPDRQEGRKWLLRAAQANDMQGQRDLAREELEGDNKDYADALFWALLSRSYIAKDIRDIRDHLTKKQFAAVLDRVAAYQPPKTGKDIWCSGTIPQAPNLEAGRLRAQSYLYMYGLGVPQDETQGLLLQGQAARLGDKISAWNVGSMDESSIRAVGEDIKQKRLAAEKSGNATAH